MYKQAGRNERSKERERERISFIISTTYNLTFIHTLFCLFYNNINHCPLNCRTCSNLLQPALTSPLHFLSVSTYFPSWQSLCICPYFPHLWQFPRNCLSLWQFPRNSFRPISVSTSSIICSISFTFSFNSTHFCSNTHPLLFHFLFILPLPLFPLTLKPSDIIYNEY